MTGIYTAQLARHAGLNVIAVAAPERAAYLASLGVSTVDRRQTDSAVVHQVVEHVRQADGTLLYALDCVSKHTAALCVDMLHRARPEGSVARAHLIGLVGTPPPSEGVATHRISFSTTVSTPCSAQQAVHTSPTLTGRANTCRFRLCTCVGSSTATMPGHGVC